MHSPDTLTGRSLKPRSVSKKMCDIAKVSLDGGYFGTQVGDSVWMPEGNLRQSGHRISEIAAAIEQTLVGGYLQEQLVHLRHRFLLVEEGRSGRLAGVAVATNQLTEEGNPETVINAFGAETEPEMAIIAEDVLRQVAQQIIEQATMFARGIESTMLSGDSNNARPSVRFKLFHGLEAKVEALGMDTALRQVIQKLERLIEGPARTQTGFGEKMDAVGAVLTRMSENMPNHPVTSAMTDGWPMLKKASEQGTAGGDDSTYRGHQKTAKAAKQLLEGIMAGVNQTSDHMFASHEQIELDEPTVNEQGNGAFLMTVRMKGGTGIGTVEFSPADSKDENPTVRFKEFSGGTSAISHLVADCIRQAGNRKWFQRMKH
jgi:hypothetical protein